MFSLSGGNGRNIRAKHLALQVVRTRRDDDQVFRLGPGEFAVRQSAAIAEIAYQVAARLANNLAKDPLIRDTRLIRYPFGTGVSSATPDTTHGERLLQAASAALARAQEGGAVKVVDA